jgi:hypothetical protein
LGGIRALVESVALRLAFRLNPDGGGEPSDHTEPLRQGRVISAPARQGRLVGALLEAHDRAEDDRMGVAFDDLLDQAIEGRDRIGEDGRAGRERGPLCAVEAPGSMRAAVSAEAMGERVMARGEQADREGALVAQCGEGRGRTREAEDKRRRAQRTGREQRDRATEARFALSTSDDRHPRGQRPHRLSKGGAVGVAQAPVAHDRASTRRSRELCVRPMATIAPPP